VDCEKVLPSDKGDKLSGIIYPKLILVSLVANWTKTPRLTIYLSSKSSPPPFPWLRLSHRKIQRIMYSKGVRQKLHAQLCIVTLCIRALIQHSW
jgi:hypothetical protein